MKTTNLKYSNKQQRGREIEDFVCQYLLQRGLSFVERNYRCKYGEIDLIMRQHELLIFVEVRFRNDDAFGDAIASITKQKQSKIIMTAKHYLLCHGLYDKISCRFDVVGVNLQNDQYLIEWIPNAFLT